MRKWKFILFLLFILSLISCNTKIEINTVPTGVTVKYLGKEYITPVKLKMVKEDPYIILIKEGYKTRRINLNENNESKMNVEMEKKNNQVTLQQNISFEKINSFLEYWLMVQNDQNYEKYKELYSSEKFRGEKKSGEKTYTFNNSADWLKDRSKMFNSYFEVSISDTSIKSNADSVNVIFYQTWSSEDYRDGGIKELTLKEVNDELKITEEIMQESEILSIDPKFDKTVKNSLLLFSDYLIVKELSDQEIENISFNLDNRILVSYIDNTDNQELLSNTYTMFYKPKTTNLESSQLVENDLGLIDLDLDKLCIIGVGYPNENELNSLIESNPGNTEIIMNEIEKVATYYLAIRVQTDLSSIQTVYNFAFRKDLPLPKIYRLTDIDESRIPHYIDLLRTHNYFNGSDYDATGGKENSFKFQDFKEADIHGKKYISFSTELSTGWLKSELYGFFDDGEMNITEKTMTGYWPYFYLLDINNNGIIDMVTDYEVSNSSIIEVDGIIIKKLSFENHNRILYD